MQTSLALIVQRVLTIEQPDYNRDFLRNVIGLVVIRTG